MSSKAPKALIAAIDQMEQLPGIAGVFSEVRLQIFHYEPMRKEDWAYITSSGWLYVNPQRQAAAAEWVYILSHCCLHLALGHIRKENRETFCGNAPATASFPDFCSLPKSESRPRNLQSFRP